MSTLAADNERTANDIYLIYDQVLHFLRHNDADPAASLGACAKLIVSICECSDKPHDTYAHAQKLIAQLWRIAETHGNAGRAPEDSEP